MFRFVLKSHPELYNFQLSPKLFRCHTSIVERFANISQMERCTQVIKFVVVHGKTLKDYFQYKQES